MYEMNEQVRSIMKNQQKKWKESIGRGRNGCRQDVIHDSRIA